MRLLRATSMILGVIVASGVTLAQPADAGPPAHVRIVFSDITGDLCEGVEQSGQWQASGAISDAGTLTGVDFAGPTVRRTLVGAHGTITFQFTFVTLVFTDTGFTETDRWVILGGTGSYTSLRGEGSGYGSAVVTGDCNVNDGGGGSTGRITRS